ncbi:MAG: DUF4965 domain-containing protein [Clostridia bacterium]|nr:DUF4965 domain-containing protein [Clostridia bacterium]
MEKASFRPSAVPLVTVDPYFSLWSFATNLTDDSTRHWTGRRMAMTGMIRYDGETMMFMGKFTGSDRNYNERVPALPQTGCTVTPTSSIYTFENDLLSMKLIFTTPILLDDLALASRPVSYVRYEITPKDDRKHELEVYVEISTEACIESTNQTVAIGRTDYSIYCGNTEQNPLNTAGDDIRCDWGYLHLCHPDAFVSRKPLSKYKRGFCRGAVEVLPEDKIYTYEDRATLAFISHEYKDMYALAYDDVHSVNYFGDVLDGYYKTRYGTFDEAVKTALAEADEIFERCAEFDARFTAQMKEINEDFANVGALAYRQAFAAHKLCQSKEGEILFMSKECFSNGCMATLDVTYPSIPLFLFLCPELVKGMLRPLAKFARSEAWPFPFAPHDAGCYPLCDGQRYGLKPDKTYKFEEQMPVEECGNFILSVAAVCRAENSNAFAEEHADLLKTWADYLAENGYKPENQLCTDDFAGHLAYNCNLSIKAIMALGAYGQLTGDAHYTDIAKDMAARFMIEARNEKATRLAFDQEDTWSLKYNAVWDRLLGLGLFPKEFYEREIALYIEKCEEYGVPLDCRRPFTKLDWLAWTTVLTDNTEYRDMIHAKIAKMVSDTVQRVPLTDFYDTITTHQHMFQHRSVVGGFFINLLCGSRNFE